MVKLRIRGFRGVFVVHFVVFCVAMMEGGRVLAQTAVAAPGGGGLGEQIAALVGSPEVARAHWGVEVEGMDGTRLYELNAGQLFHPASNTKLFTTAAAMALLGPEKRFETRVVLAGGSGEGAGQTGLLLIGGGDANLSGRELPYTAPQPQQKGMPAAVQPVRVNSLRYLEEMADQVAASGVKKVRGDVWGDDRLFPWKPYPQNWAEDDLVWGYGAPVSALTVGDNQMRLTVTPGVKAGDAVVVELEQAVPYYTLEVDATTAAPRGEKAKGRAGAASVATTSVATEPVAIVVERDPGSRVLRVSGRIAADAQPEVEEVAIADPAEYAAMAFKAMLEARGVEVTGRGRALHGRLVDQESFLKEAREPLAVGTNGDVQRSPGAACGQDCAGQAEKALATHLSPVLAEDVVLTNKVSENLHAELFLRQLGSVFGEAGDAAQGARVVRQFLVGAGVDKDDFVFFDGSGLSGHDLVTPRAVVRLLEYASGQPWFAAWKASLPVGGVDGTLQSRFTEAPLQGHVFAKTGTLGEARALSGYVECASGKTVAFSILVGEYVPGSAAVQKAMDAVVAAVAAAN